MTLQIGKVKIKPERVTKSGRGGYFITQREMLLIANSLERKSKISRQKDKSILPGMIGALKEVEADLKGKKKLKNASEVLKHI